MDSPTSFSSLPPELVDKICRDSGLQKKDLIALRLTSKSQGVHLSASKEFATRYFNYINLVYTRYSLQAFGEICKHPVYGPAVRHVHLSCARFVPDCFEEVSMDQLDDLIMIDGAERQVCLDHIQLLANRCNEEEGLKRSGDAEDLLAAAFMALSQWGHPLLIAVSTTETNALGANRINGSCWGDYAHWQCDILGTVNLLYHAAMRGSCAVKMLQLEGAVWDNLVDTSSESLSSLAQLCELNLCIWPEEDNLLVPSLDGMVPKLLENAVQLKTLHVDEVGYDEGENPSYLRTIFSIMPTMRLEKIMLTLIDLDRFKPFETRIESLCHLELITCRTDRSLKNVLLSIQKNFPRLAYLRLSGFSRAWKHKEIVFEGFQGVNDGIDELIQSRLRHHVNPGTAVLWNGDEN